MQNVTKEFIKYIHNNGDAFDTFYEAVNFGFEHKTQGYYIVSDIKIDINELWSVDIEYITFQNCYFETTQFWDAEFRYCEFLNCKFKHLQVSNSSFIICHFYDCKFDYGSLEDTDFLDCSFQNVKYNSCKEIVNIEMTGCYIDLLYFNKCNVIDCRFFSYSSHKNLSIFFNSSAIYNVSFIDVDMTGTRLSNCAISECIFSNCILNENTFDEKCMSDVYTTSSIDIQTILHNPHLSERTLMLFGIKNPFAIDYIKELVTEVKFQSVFISYSFKDSDFAAYLNTKLRQLGVNTFLWEHDAPGGKRLKKIMQDYIQKYDRVLFIASEHSLKSEACHFELKESRERQNKEWKDIYYPIHIDNYLFKLTKEDIPRKHRDEYWTNIEEIKEFHSVDFSAFRTNYIDNPEFDEKVAKLAKDLKL